MNYLKELATAEANLRQDRATKRRICAARFAQIKTLEQFKWSWPKKINQLQVAELKKWKLACPPNDLDLIFPNEAGQPLNHNNVVSSYFNPALKEAKIERIRFHDLRPTYASLLIEQGENIKYIQTQLGHSSPTVTWIIYAHLMKKVNQEAANRLENTIFNPTGHKMVNNRVKNENLKSHKHLTVSISHEQSFICY